MALDIDTVFRDNFVKGDIHSGANEPDKLVGTDNTGPLTLSIGGEPPCPVLNLADNPLSADEWAFVALFIRNGENCRLVISAGAGAAAAPSASDAAESADWAEGEADRAEAAKEILLSAEGEYTGGRKIEGLALGDEDDEAVVIS